MEDSITLTNEQREEVFAREYVIQRALKNPNAAVLACVKAGFSGPDLNVITLAPRMLAKASIQKLIMQFENESIEIEPREYSRDLFLDELQAVAQKALEANAFPSVISAVKTQAQLLGMLDQTVNINHSVSAKDLDLQTLRAMVADRAAREGGLVIEGDFRVLEGDAGDEV